MLAIGVAKWNIWLCLNRCIVEKARLTFHPAAKFYYSVGPGCMWSSRWQKYECKLSGTKAQLSADMKGDKTVPSGAWLVFSEVSCILIDMDTFEPSCAYDRLQFWKCKFPCKCHHLIGTNLLKSIIMSCTLTNTRKKKWLQRSEERKTRMVKNKLKINFLYNLMFVDNISKEMSF